MKFNIVIIGAGEVGFNLAKSLSKEEHDITVIDIDPQKCQKVTNNIDARVIEGDGCSQRIIQEIEMNEVDYLIALTRIDEVNLVASKIGKERGAKKVICRLRNTEYGKKSIIDSSQFGINHIVFPEKAARDEIKKIITQPSSFDIETFKSEKITLIGILLDSSSPLIGRTMENVEISNPYIPHKLSIICRGDSTFIPHNKTRYAINDMAYFAVPSNYIEQVQVMAGKSSFKVNNIMVMGGGKIGRLLAASLQDDYNVKLFIIISFSTAFPMSGCKDIPESIPITPLSATVSDKITTLSSSSHALLTVNLQSTCLPPFNPMEDTEEDGCNVI